MKVLIHTILIFIVCNASIAQSNLDFNTVSQDLLQAVIKNKSTQEYQDIIAKATVEQLTEEMPSDHEKLAFWINVYNAYIQIILCPNPELYQDRRGFFRIKQIPIAGMQLSFADIEHGIIRGSQNEFFLGYISKLFPPDYEKALRVNERDFRIHFALNCGAKDCPPVAIYTADNLDYELDYMSNKYLNEYSQVLPEREEVHTAQLFAWFRGDFGGSSGIRNILEGYNVIPKSPRYKMLQRKYDWTLRLDNFVIIPRQS